MEKIPTPTSGHTISSPESSATHSIKRKRSLSLNGQSGQRELRRVPLEKRYLERHLAALSSPEMLGSNQGGEDFSIGSKGKSSDKTALWAKERMEYHRIYQNHHNYKQYPDFVATVQRPFEQNRHYEVRPKSVEFFNSRFAYYKDGNEESLKHALLKSIIKDEFDVLVEPYERDPGESDPLYRPSVPELEGIVSNYSCRLRAGHLPHTYNDPSYEKKKIIKRLQDEGLYTPEPDAIWGFDPAKLPRSDFAPDTHELMTLCKKMHWPFFVMQCKLDASYD